MRCESCHGKTYLERWACPECNGSGITSCCEGNPNMPNGMEHDPEFVQWQKERLELFKNPTLEAAQN
jgi:hypothetical protein